MDWLNNFGAIFYWIAFWQRVRSFYQFNSLPLFGLGLYSHIYWIHVFLIILFPSIQIYKYIVVKDKEERKKKKRVKITHKHSQKQLKELISSLLYLFFYFILFSTPLLFFYYTKKRQNKKKHKKRVVNNEKVKRNLTRFKFEYIIFTFGYIIYYN